MPFERDQVQVPVMPVLTITGFKRSVPTVDVISLYTPGHYKCNSNDSDIVCHLSSSTGQPSDPTLSNCLQSSKNLSEKPSEVDVATFIPVPTQRTSSLRSLTLRYNGDTVSGSSTPVLTGFRSLSDSNFELKSKTFEICKNKLDQTKQLTSSILLKVSTNPSLVSNSTNTDTVSSLEHKKNLLTSCYQWKTLVSSQVQDTISINNAILGSSPTIGRSRRDSSVSEDSTSSGYGSSSSTDSVKTWKLTGLNNLGNTCFINAIVQCLCHTEPLFEYCIHGNYEDDINTTISNMKGELMKAFAKLVHSMSRANSSVPTCLKDFHSQLRVFTSCFPSNSQQDAQEFLRYLLQGLHEDVNTVRTILPTVTQDIDETLSESQKSTEACQRYLRNDNSKIIDIFLGQLRSTLQCLVCGHASVTFDPFWDLSVSIPKGFNKVSIQQCLDLFTKEELLDGDEKPTCSQCKTRQRCSKRFSIHKFPQILVLHIKRFSLAGKNQPKEFTANVEYPLKNFNLRPFASERVSYIPMYNLYAVANHSGSGDSGHYTAVCRHPYTEEWHQFNDTKVSKVSSKRVVSSNAYILFYELSSHCSRL
ncbi:ubiquitin carboxyl-terminal hydrolase 2-like [Limulus polyphemus]|uniref:Ubiquitin carboxyl-terminal hydrolase n=1 Tax=Limulus polyphemus TaxID=6850 RepID=A0ABM1S1A9_LIMPO|nr:ubiquitin carboxyl-terminal hydrolase 2-like [Limulus polyphemus]